MRMVVTFVSGVTRVIMARLIVHCVHVVTRVIHAVHVVRVAVVEIVRPAGCTAVVPLLSLANQVVLLIALALVWRAVTFSARVVITRAHRWVCAVVFAVVLGTVTVLAVVIVL